MLKSKVAKLLKKITLILTSMARSKTLALKNKTNALKTRFMIFSLLRDKKVLMSSISHKLQALVANEQHKEEHGEEGENDVVNVDQNERKSIVVYNHSSVSLPSPSQIEMLENSEGEKFPDLTHSLFDMEMEDPGGSVIDLVKKSKKEGEEFRLEDEIDQVADLFIKRFHRQMRMQKQVSINERYQEMLEMSA
ncbi:hypothetical protein M5689_021205 [Euphorbia peplus]|nr:hypothetical protein M5689_021205 [Euphorbia peplus]